MTVGNKAGKSGGGSAAVVAQDQTSVVVFQAEDGIRDGHVTGVQTCALPISYTIVISNTGTGPSAGAVTVTDNMPVGLLLVSMAGAGWSCSSNRDRKSVV